MGFFAVRNCLDFEIYNEKNDVNHILNIPEFSGRFDKYIFEYLSKCLKLISVIFGHTLHIVIIVIRNPNV